MIDTQRWMGFSFFVGFNDIFFMALMFFLSGLFVYRSLEHKGVKTFLRDRLLRLGLPFVVAAAVIAPLAYYPAYLRTPSPAGISGFWQLWMGLGNWPAGPAWFIWLLLAFDVVAAVLFALAPSLIGRIASSVSKISGRPIALYALIVVLSAVAYIPLVFRVGPDRWSSFGPFSFQTGRPLHYLVYFLVAVGAGAYGLKQGLFACDGKLARRWGLWVSAMFALLLPGRRHVPCDVERQESRDALAAPAGNRMGTVVCLIVLRIHVALRTLCHSSDRNLRQPHRERLRHVPGALCVRKLAAICAPSRLDVRPPKGRVGHAGDDHPELGDDLHTATHSGSRAGYLIRSQGFTAILRIGIQDPFPIESLVVITHALSVKIRANPRPPRLSR